MTSPRQFAFIAITMLLVYYEIYRWVPLGRWNGQVHFPVSNDQFYPDIVIGALLVLFLVSFLRGWRAGMVAASLLLGLWVVAHFFDWWLPYLRDLPSNAGRYSFYASHTQLLPVIGHHFPPDGGHTVLDLLLYPTWFVALWATILSLKRPRHA